MRAFRVARAITDPQHVCGCVVPIARCRIDARQCLLVSQQQRLVGGKELGFPQPGEILRIDPARLHERDRLGRAVGDVAEPLADRTAFDESQIPAVDAAQIRIPASRERAQQVEGARGLGIGANLTLGIGHPRRSIKFDPVDDIATVRRKFHAAADFGRSGPGLCKLTR